jgi:hypothetical protein
MIEEIMVFGVMSSCPECEHEFLRFIAYSTTVPSKPFGDARLCQCGKVVKPKVTVKAMNANEKNVFLNVGQDIWGEK